MSVTVANATPVCVFGIIGQSNQEFPGNSALAPGNLSGALQYHNGVLGGIAAPVNKSFIQAFANTFWNQTGVIPLMVPTAVPATSQTVQMANYFQRGNLHWDIDGSLVPASIAKIRAAIHEATNPQFGYNVRLCGIISGGHEDEGFGVSIGQIDILDYEAARINMFDRYRAEFPGVKFYIFTLGNPTGSSAQYTDGFIKVREIQEKRSLARSDEIIVSRLASSFVESGNIGDAAGIGLHYDQNGLNMQGVEGASTIVALGLWK